MDSKVESAFHASLNKFAESAQKDATPLEGALTAVFNQEGNFLEKVEAFDAAFDEYPAFEELREVLFDLLMINFFASDMKLLNEDYLDSEEWAGIEEQTIERGTELLNLLLYINECGHKN